MKPVVAALIEATARFVPSDLMSFFYSLRVTENSYIGNLVFINQIILFSGTIAKESV